MRETGDDMLTPEQMRLRRQDNELRQLRREKQELEDKLAGSRKSLAALVREMAKIAGRDYVAYLTAEPFIHENFGFNLNEIRQSKSIADELRRMAEGEKHE